jgi:hypothetical protein
VLPRRPLPGHRELSGGFVCPDTRRRGRIGGGRISSDMTTSLRSGTNLESAGVVTVFG